MKTFLKGYCCCGKIRGEMCQEHLLHIQNFYLLSYPVFPCDPFSLLGSSFAGQFLIFFLSRNVSILLSFPGIISSPAPVYKTISTHWLGSFPSRYALRFLLPIQTFLEAPSEQATACSLRYLTPLAVPCTWEEFTLREPSLSLLSSLCHPNPIAFVPPSPVSFDLIMWNFILWPLPSTRGPPLCPETLLSHVSPGHSTVPVNIGLFPFL